ncbi:Uncharacterized protein TCM_018904 [Theobroma cacao]|uniref:Uncharacterized protein n=1 Tax=Theobroma cacao TaxID=3641 RepID=A0A061EH76_THECC|nr:Uncharacterized protein TCM_018904 [Theobroma cacao]
MTLKRKQHQARQSFKKLKQERSKAPSKKRTQEHINSQRKSEKPGCKKEANGVESKTRSESIPLRQTQNLDQHRKRAWPTQGAAPSLSRIGRRRTYALHKRTQTSHQGKTTKHKDTRQPPEAKCHSLTNPVTQPRSTLSLPSRNAKTHPLPPPLQSPLLPLFLPFSFRVNALFSLNSFLPPTRTL